jgi:hypothetical protein
MRGPLLRRTGSRYLWRWRARDQLMASSRVGIPDIEAQETFSGIPAWHGTVRRRRRGGTRPRCQSRIGVGLIAVLQPRIQCGRL